MGVHPFRDPRLTDDFAAPPLEIDVGEHHVYAADWRPGRVNFPERDAPGEHAYHVPQLAVDYVTGRRRRAT